MTCGRSNSFRITEPLTAIFCSCSALLVALSAPQPPAEFV
jgi:hypothetical protein